MTLLFLKFPQYFVELRRLSLFLLSRFTRKSVSRSKEAFLNFTPAALLLLGEKNNLFAILTSVTYSEHDRQLHLCDRLLLSLFTFSKLDTHK